MNGLTPLHPQRVVDPLARVTYPVNSAEICAAATANQRACDVGGMHDLIDTMIERLGPEARHLHEHFDGYLVRYGGQWRREETKQIARICEAAEVSGLRLTAALNTHFDKHPLSDLGLQERLEILVLCAKSFGNLSPLFFELFSRVATRVSDLDSTPDEKLRVVLGLLGYAFKRWGPIPNECAEKFAALTEKSPLKLAVNEIGTIAFLCATDARSASETLTNALRIVSAGRGQSIMNYFYILARHLENVAIVAKNRGPGPTRPACFGREHQGPLSELFASAILKNRHQSTSNVLGILRDVYGRPEIGEHLRFLSEAFGLFNWKLGSLGISSADMTRHKLDILLSPAKNDCSLRTFVLAGLKDRTQSPLNPFHVPAAERLERLKKFGDVVVDRTLAVPPGLEIPSSVAPLDGKWRTRDGRDCSRWLKDILTELKPPARNNRPVGDHNHKSEAQMWSHVEPPSSKEVESVIDELRSLLGGSPGTVSADYRPRLIIPLIANALRTDDPKLIKEVGTLSARCLPDALGQQLPPPPRGGTFPQKVDFFRAIEFMLDETAHSALQAEGLSEEGIKKFKRSTPLYKIRAHLKALKEPSPTEPCTIALVDGRNYAAANADEFTCLHRDKLGFNFEDPRLTILSMVDLERKKMIGAEFLYYGIVHGMPSVILYGRGLNRDEATRYDVDAIAAGIVAHGKLIARTSNCPGGLLQALNAPGEEGDPWKCGRVAEAPEFIAAIKRQDHEVVEIDPVESALLTFPRNMPTVRYLARF